MSNEILNAKILEGTNSLQCICPVCDYGKGYTQPVMPGEGSLKVITCKGCSTQIKVLTD